MKAEHICFISDDYPTKDRMVDVFVQQLVEALVDEGVKISVVAPQSLVRSLFRGVKLMPIQQNYSTAQNNSYQVYRPFSLSFSNGNKLLYKIAKSFNRRQINKSLYKISPQIVYGHFWHNAMKGASYAQEKRRPLFVACGEGDDSLDNWASKLTESQKKAIQQQIRGVISVSTENKRKCLTYGLSSEDNTVVLPNCVNDKVFHPQNGTEFREKLGAKPSDFVISFTGAFIDRKGYNRLSNAIDKLNDDNIKVIFSGKPMAGHEKDIPNCKGIIHCGVVNHDDLPQYLCASDVFVLPTLKEGCCNSIVEALACGIPVISSDCAFNDDILSEKNSLRINPESVDEIASAIKLLRDDGVFYNVLKKNALANSSNYSIVTRAKKILNFIESNL